MEAEAKEARIIPVNVNNFVRAETDRYFLSKVKQGGFGKLIHERQMTDVDKQTVVRMNRDTLYSSGVFDLQAGPLKITLPDAGKRFLSMQIISQDHFTIEVVYKPGSYNYPQEKVGTRYVFIVIRTLANPENHVDLEAAHQVQNAIKVEQKSAGTFEIPDWDLVSQGKIRDALAVLGSFGEIPDKFGTREEINPVHHLIGTAIGWGGNPNYAAMYFSVYPDQNEPLKAYTLTVKEVPVDGFWSVSVYNSKGFFEKNDLNAYTLNNLTAKPNPDGSITIRFGNCEIGADNCLPVMPGWNYTVRLYRPRKELLEGMWQFPEIQPVD
ncbi:DUF1254 domain-containing protein [Adhaeribacter terreus]|uniref:DUF1254 domain-containing protein n=1 Tax=Adhaeribacter terreus TaxID=529703 RepID=A0ABW0EAC5_9BACT